MNRLTTRIYDRFTRSLRKLARNRQSKLAQFLNGLAVEFHLNFENWHYKPGSNGEARVMECLGQSDGMKVVFDGGANRGSWSLIAASKFPAATIHAFELSSQVAQMLQANVAAEPRVVVNACGLSDDNKEIEFFFAPGHDILSSGVAVTGSVPTEKVKGRVVRGSDYCREKGIERIDFLKLDLEGMEHLALRGFAEMLERRAIRVIQFEYGRVSIESHFLLKDFYTFLTGYGFVIGKIYPREVLFKTYYYTDENFLGPNYLAVLDSETELIRRLSADEPK